MAWGVTSTYSSSWIYSNASSRLNFTAKLGQNLKANAHYSLDIAWLPTINVEASISRYSGSLRIGGTDIFSEVSYWSHQELVYLSDVRWKRINFKTGIKNQYNNVDSRTLFGQLVSQEFSKDVLVGDYIGLFANGHYYTLDDYYYPERGVSFAFDANYDFLKAGSSDFSPMLTLRFDLKNVFPLGGRLALISDIHLRDIYTASETIDLEGGVHRDISILHSNFIGGSMSRRYTEGHIPFFGINSQPGHFSFSSSLYAYSTFRQTSTSNINGVERNPVPSRQP